MPGAGLGPSPTAPGYLHWIHVLWGLIGWKWSGTCQQQPRAKVKGRHISIALVTGPGSSRFPQLLSNRVTLSTCHVLKCCKHGNQYVLINCYNAFPNMKLHKPLITFNTHNKTSEVTNGPHKYSPTHFPNIVKNTCV